MHGYGPAVNLAPMLATTGALPADDGRWAYEVKWDGARALVTVDGGHLSIASRAGNDITSSYPELRGLGEQIGTRSVVLDGEVVAFGSSGIPDFGLLQSRMHVTRPGAGLLTATPVTYLVFDLLFAGGVALLDLPYDQRRAALDALQLGGAHWQVPPSFPDDGAALLASTREQGLEGVVAKRRDSTYVPGRRSEHWVKVKNLRRQSAVVIGWKPGEGGRAGRIGSLLLAVNGATGLLYAGHVGTGFSAEVLRLLGRLLEPLATDDQPCPVPREYARVARWVRPEVIAEVEFTGWTKDGRLRHPSYRGLRDDLRVTDLVRE